MATVTMANTNAREDLILAMYKLNGSRDFAPPKMRRTGPNAAKPALEE